MKIFLYEGLRLARLAIIFVMDAIAHIFHQYKRYMEAIILRLNAQLWIILVLKPQGNYINCTCYSISITLILKGTGQLSHQFEIL